MSEDNIGRFKKIRAAICHNCPMCKHARGNPQSVIGKILHHKMHAEHCPMWKAEQEVYGKERQVVPDP
jgi:hypothetical protein